MKAQLAMRLLADLMNWDEATATREFAWLRLMVGAKYDHYQGYSPGARFYVSLLAWIGQFQPKDRAAAYALIRERLIFISQEEMHHLVALTMPILQRAMRREVAQSLHVPIYRTWGGEAAERRLHLMALRTLYVGLSDGAKIDIFRRENEGVVSTEQVVAASEISDEKWEKVATELRKRLNSAGFQDEEARFERVCLIDDFTASGTTLIRQADTGQWVGKIPTFCNQNVEKVGRVLSAGCCIHVHHYLGTARATEIAQTSIEAFRLVNQTFRFAITFSAKLSESIVINDNATQDLVRLLKSYYDPSVHQSNSHLGVDVWYGYKQCGLPLVLHHNTPNNSVAILWAASGAKHAPQAHRMKPLFSRKQRHIDHG